MLPMPPLAGPGLPGMGPSPMGQPSPASLDSLLNLQQQPSPGGEEEALAEASTALGLALSRVYMRSPTAAKMIADALSRVQSARTELTKDQGVGAPPNLMGGLPPMQGNMPSNLGML